MKVILFLKTHHYKILNRDGWEFFCNVQEKNPAISLRKDQYKSIYIDTVKNIKPDFVITVCAGCTETLYDKADWPKGPKYITWSTDSYKHTCRATNSDLHLSSIPDEKMKSNDNFLPLFSCPRSCINLKDRTTNFGKIFRPHKLSNDYRNKFVDKIETVLPGFLTKKISILTSDYLQEIKQFKFGLNIPVHYDGLPNFRSFELGMCGVKSVSPRNNEKVLKELFEDNIEFFDKIEEIPDITKKSYDEYKLQRFFIEKHTLQQRLKTLFKVYYDINFPLISNDYEIR